MLLCGDTCAPLAHSHSEMAWQAEATLHRHLLSFGCTLDPSSGRHVQAAGAGRQALKKSCMQAADLKLPLSADTDSSWTQTAAVALSCYLAADSRQLKPRYVQDAASPAAAHAVGCRNWHAGYPGCGLPLTAADSKQDFTVHGH